VRVLVIPSNREKYLCEFLAAWEGKGGWDSVIVVEDGPTKTFGNYSWAEIAKECGDDAWIFSRKDSAIRAFGFLMAWRGGADHVLTLDDDCFPRDGGNFFGCHLEALGGHRRWVSSVPGMRVRGLPYANVGRLKGVVANVGLWGGYPDLDAISSLALLGEGCCPSYTLPLRNQLVPRGQYIPVCGMNLCFTREALPLFYFPPMGEGQPFSRFDDIWAGVIAKRICDHLGWSISVGEPFVEHRRASDPFANLVKEAPGVAANEDFWEAVDGVRLTENTALGAVAEMGQGLAPRADPYRAKLGKALQVWVRLLERGAR
jgi:reversibly glycosylated polypeptide/UDP-arabinopyranose mutase